MGSFMKSFMKSFMSSPHNKVSWAVFFLLTQALPSTLSQSSSKSFPCATKGQWWDQSTAVCYTCSREPCHIGFYRQTCTSRSTSDAQCVPCSPPPANGVHVTGGLPYTYDGCLWACKDGFFKDTSRKLCIPCSREPCTSSGFIRETCTMLGQFTRDAQCICPFWDLKDAQPPGERNCTNTSSLELTSSNTTMEMLIEDNLEDILNKTS